MTAILDRDGDCYREEPGRYRTTGSDCRACHGTIWRAIVRERDGGRSLRCLACGHMRFFPFGGVTFEKDAAA